MQRMEKVHYRLYAKVPREKLWSAVNDLKGRVGSLKDDEIAVGVQGILAMVGDGHTIVAFERRGMPARPRYPLELELYKEGLFVRSAPQELAEIVGCEVVTIGRATAEEALRAVAPYCSRDNAMGIKLHAPVYLTYPAVLSYFKLADDMSKVNDCWSRKPDGEEKSVELKPLVTGEAETKGVGESECERPRAPEPISFKKNDDPFWFEYLPEKKLVYFQFNEVTDKPDETLEKFCGRMFAFINEHAGSTTW